MKHELNIDNKLQINSLSRQGCIMLSQAYQMIKVTEICCVWEKLQQFIHREKQWHPYLYYTLQKIPCDCHSYTDDG